MEGLLMQTRTACFLNQLNILIKQDVLEQFWDVCEFKFLFSHYV